jgi:hypothetical protein
MNKHRKTVARRDIKRREYKLGPKLDNRSELSPKDATRLRTLVRKYGANLIKKTVSTIDLNPPRGRPPLYFSDHRQFAEFINKKAEELRQAGSKSPIKDAYYATYELAFGKLEEMERRHPGHFDRWLKSHKRQRRIGQRYRQDLEERLEHFSKRVKARGIVRFFGDAELQALLDTLQRHEHKLGNLATV